MRPLGLDHFQGTDATKLVSLSEWHNPKRRNWARLISLVLTLTFVFPYLTWAFETAPSPSTLPQVRFAQRAVTIPARLGSITAAHPGGKRLVVCVQDLHCNYEAQTHIAGIIEALTKEHGLRLVAVEGASRPIDVSDLADFPVADVKREVADHFVRLGKISGSELFAATGEPRVELVGIEDDALYQANRTAVAAFLNDESQGLIYDLREVLNPLKSSLYTPALLELDARRTAYRDGELPLPKYAVSLRTLAVQHRLDLDAYPMLTAYVDQRQAAFATATDPDALYRQIDQVDQDLRRRMYTSDDQRQLDALQRRLDILERLLNISATPQDLQEFRADPGAFAGRHYAEFAVRQDPNGDLLAGLEVEVLDRYAAQAMEFYRVADQRSQAFVRNTLHRMDDQRVDLSLLVTGGFHTEKVLAELRRQGVSYLCVRPRVDQQDLVNPYYSLLRNRHIPLEKLLAQNQEILALETSFPQIGIAPSPDVLVEKLARGVVLVSDTVLAAENGGVRDAAELRQRFETLVGTHELGVEVGWNEVQGDAKTHTFLVPLRVGGRTLDLLVRPATTTEGLRTAVLARMQRSGQEFLLVNELPADQAADLLNAGRGLAGLSGEAAWTALFAGAPMSALLAYGSVAMVAPGWIQRFQVRLSGVRRSLQPLRTWALGIPRILRDLTRTVATPNTGVLPQLRDQALAFFKDLAGRFLPTVPVVPGPAASGIILGGYNGPRTIQALVKALTILLQTETGRRISGALAPLAAGPAIQLAEGWVTGLFSGLSAGDMALFFKAFGHEIVSTEPAALTELFSDVLDLRQMLRTDPALANRINSWTVGNLEFGYKALMTLSENRGPGQKVPVKVNYQRRSYEITDLQVVTVRRMQDIPGVSAERRDAIQAQLADVGAFFAVQRTPAGETIGVIYELESARGDRFARVHEFLEYAVGTDHDQLVELTRAAREAAAAAAQRPTHYATPAEVGGVLAQGLRNVRLWLRQLGPQNTRAVTVNDLAWSVRGLQSQDEFLAWLDQFRQSWQARDLTPVSTAPNGPTEQRAILASILAAAYQNPNLAAGLRPLLAGTLFGEARQTLAQIVGEEGFKDAEMLARATADPNVLREINALPAAVRERLFNVLASGTFAVRAKDPQSLPRDSMRAQSLRDRHRTEDHQLTFELLTAVLAGDAALFAKVPAAIFATGSSVFSSVATEARTIGLKGLVVAGTPINVDVPALAQLARRLFTSHEYGRDREGILALNRVLWGLANVTDQKAYLDIVVPFLTGTSSSAFARLLPADRTALVVSLLTAGLVNPAVAPNLFPNLLRELPGLQDLRGVRSLSIELGTVLHLARAAAGDASSVAELGGLSYEVRDQTLSVLASPLLVLGAYDPIKLGEDDLASQLARHDDFLASDTGSNYHRLTTVLNAVIAGDPRVYLKLTSFLNDRTNSAYRAALTGPGLERPAMPTFGRQISETGIAATAGLAAAISIATALGLSFGSAGLAGLLAAGLGWTWSGLIVGLLGAVVSPVLALPFLVMGVFLLLGLRVRATRGRSADQPTDADLARLSPQWRKALQDGIARHAPSPRSEIAHYGDLPRGGEAAELEAGKITADLVRLAVLPRALQDLILRHELAHQAQDQRAREAGRAAPGRLAGEIYAFWSQARTVPRLVLTALAGLPLPQRLTVVAVAAFVIFLPAVVVLPWAALLPAVAALLLGSAALTFAILGRRTSPSRTPSLSDLWTAFLAAQVPTDRSAALDRIITHVQTLATPQEYQGLLQQLDQARRPVTGRPYGGFASEGEALAVLASFLLAGYRGPQPADRMDLLVQALPSAEGFSRDAVHAADLAARAVSGRTPDARPELATASADTVQALALVLQAALWRTALPDEIAWNARRAQLLGKKVREFFRQEAKRIRTDAAAAFSAWSEQVAAGGLVDPRQEAQYRFHRSVGQLADAVVQLDRGRYGSLLQDLIWPEEVPLAGLSEDQVAALVEGLDRVLTQDPALSSLFDLGKVRVLTAPSAPTSAENGFIMLDQALLDHPARVAAEAYRQALRVRLARLQDQGLLAHADRLTTERWFLRSWVLFQTLFFLHRATPQGRPLFTDGDRQDYLAWLSRTEGYSVETLRGLNELARKWVDGEPVSLQTLSLQVLQLVLSTGQRRGEFVDLAPESLEGRGQDLVTAMSNLDSEFQTANAVDRLRTALAAEAERQRGRDANDPAWAPAVSDHADRSFRQVIAGVPWSLVKRTLVTLAVIALFFIGMAIPIPGIDPAQTATMVSNPALSIFYLLSGGGLSKLSIFGLGLAPYFFSTKVMMVLGFFFKPLKSLQTQGEPGRRILERYTFWMTVAVAVVQAVLVVNFFPAVFGTLALSAIGVAALTVGAVIVTWMNLQIRDRGLGGKSNSVLMTVMTLPRLISLLGTVFTAGILGFPVLPIVVGLLVILALAIILNTVHYSVPLRSARSSRPEDQPGLPKRFLPLKLDYFGLNSVLGVSVMISLLGMLGVTLFGLPIVPGTLAYLVVAAVLLMVFSVFGTRLQLNPKNLARNLSRSGTFIPGRAPGAATGSYLTRLATLLPLVGGTLLVVISLLPDMVGFQGIGISILMLVSTVLGIVDQVRGTVADQRLKAQQAVRDGEGRTVFGRILAVVLPTGILAGLVGLGFALLGWGKLVFAAIGGAAIIGGASWVFLITGGLLVIGVFAYRHWIGPRLQQASYQRRMLRFGRSKDTVTREVKRYHELVDGRTMEEGLALLRQEAETVRTKNFDGQPRELAEEAFRRERERLLAIGTVAIEVQKRARGVSILLARLRELEPNRFAAAFPDADHPDPARGALPDRLQRFIEENPTLAKDGAVTRGALDLTYTLHPNQVLAAIAFTDLPKPTRWGRLGRTVSTFLTPEPTAEQIAGYSVQLATGQGKTDTAALALFAVSQLKRGAHLMTPNIDLAEDQGNEVAQWLGPLGVQVAIAESYDESTGEWYSSVWDEATRSFVRTSDHEQAYRADITYGTESYFNFDYQTRVNPREPYYRIDDEGDVTYFVEGITPRSISDFAQEVVRDERLKERLARAAARVRPGMITVDTATQHVRLTPQGQQALGGEARLFEVPDLQPVLARLIIAETLLGLKARQTRPGEFFEVSDKDGEETRELTPAGRHYLEQEVFGLPTTVSLTEHWVLESYLQAGLDAHTQYARRREGQTERDPSLPAGATEYQVVGGDITVISRDTGQPAIGLEVRGGIHQALQAREIMESLRAGRPAAVRITSIADSLRQLLPSQLARLYPHRNLTTATPGDPEELLNRLGLLPLYLPSDQAPSLVRDFYEDQYFLSVEEQTAAIGEVVRRHQVISGLMIGVYTTDKLDSVNDELLGFWAKQGFTVRIIDHTTPPETVARYVQEAEAQAQTLRNALAEAEHETDPEEARDRVLDRFRSENRVLTLCVVSPDKKTPLSQIKGISSLPFVVTLGNPRITRGFNVVAEDMPIIEAEIAVSEIDTQQLAGRVGRQGLIGYFVKIVSILDNATIRKYIPEIILQMISEGVEGNLLGTRWIKAIAKGIRLMHQRHARSQAENRAYYDRFNRPVETADLQVRNLEDRIRRSDADQLGEMFLENTRIDLTQMLTEYDHPRKLRAKLTIEFDAVVERYCHFADNRVWNMTALKQEIRTLFPEEIAQQLIGSIERTMDRTRREGRPLMREIQRRAHREVIGKVALPVLAMYGVTLLSQEFEARRLMNGPNDAALLRERLEEAIVFGRRDQLHTLVELTCQTLQARILDWKADGVSPEQMKAVQTVLIENIRNSWGTGFLRPIEEAMEDVQYLGFADRDSLSRFKVLAERIRDEYFGRSIPRVFVAAAVMAMTPEARRPLGTLPSRYQRVRPEAVPPSTVQRRAAEDALDRLLDRAQLGGLNLFGTAADLSMTTGWSLLTNLEVSQPFETVAVRVDQGVPTAAAPAAEVAPQAPVRGSPEKAQAAVPHRTTPNFFRPIPRSDSTIIPTAPGSQTLPVEDAALYRAATAVPALLRKLDGRMTSEGRPNVEKATYGREDDQAVLIRINHPGDLGPSDLAYLRDLAPLINGQARVIVVVKADPDQLRKPGVSKNLQRAIKGLRSVAHVRSALKIYAVQDDGTLLALNPQGRASGPVRTGEGSTTAGPQAIALGEALRTSWQVLRGRLPEFAGINPVFGAAVLLLTAGAVGYAKLAAALGLPTVATTADLGEYEPMAPRAASISYAQDGKVYLDVQAMLRLPDFLRNAFLAHERAHAEAQATEAQAYRALYDRAASDISRAWRTSWPAKLLRRGYGNILVALGVLAVLVLTVFGTDLVFEQPYIFPRLVLRPQRALQAGDVSAVQRLAHETGLDAFAQPAFNPDYWARELSAGRLTPDEVRTAFVARQQVLDLARQTGFVIATAGDLSYWAERLEPVLGDREALAAATQALTVSFQERVQWRRSRETVSDVLQQRLMEYHALALGQLEDMVDPRTGWPLDHVRTTEQGREQARYTTLDNIGKALIVWSLAGRRGQIDTVQARARVVRALQTLDAYSAKNNRYGMPYTIALLDDLDENGIPRPEARNNSLIDVGNLVADLLVTRQVYAGDPEVQVLITNILQRMDWTAYRTGDGLLYAEVKNGEINRDWVLGMHNESFFAYLIAVGQGVVPAESIAKKNALDTVNQGYGFSFPGLTLPGIRAGGAFLFGLPRLYLEGTEYDRALAQLGGALMAYAREQDLPFWGSSASTDPNGVGYRGYNDVIPQVVQPHALALFLDLYPSRVASDLSRMEERGVITGSEVRDAYDLATGKISTSVTFWDLSLFWLALDNYLTGGDSREYFQADPLVIRALERIPAYRPDDPAAAREQARTEWDLIYRQVQNRTYDTAHPLQPLHAQEALRMAARVGFGDLRTEYGVLGSVLGAGLFLAVAAMIVYAKWAKGHPSLPRFTRAVDLPYQDLGPEAPRWVLGGVRDGRVFLDKDALVCLPRGLRELVILHEEAHAFRRAGEDQAYRVIFERVRAAFGRPASLGTPPVAGESGPTAAPETLADLAGRRLLGERTVSLRALYLGLRTAFFAGDRTPANALRVPIEFFTHLLAAGLGLVQVTAVWVANLGSGNVVVDDGDPRWDGLKRKLALPDVETMRTYDIKNLRFRPLSERGGFFKRLLAGELLGAYSEPGQAADHAQVATIYVPDRLYTRMLQPEPRRDATRRSAWRTLGYRLDTLLFGAITGYEAERYFRGEAWNPIAAVFGIGRYARVAELPEPAALDLATQGEPMLEWLAKHDRVGINPADLAAVVAAKSMELRRLLGSAGTDTSLDQVRSALDQALAAGADPTSLSTLLTVLRTLPLTEAQRTTLAGRLKTLAVAAEGSLQGQASELTANAILSQLYQGAPGFEVMSRETALAPAVREVYLLALPDAYRPMLEEVNEMLATLLRTGTAAPELKRDLEDLQAVLSRASQGIPGRMDLLEPGIGERLWQDVARRMLAGSPQARVIGEGLTERGYGVLTGRVGSVTLGDIALAKPQVFEVPVPRQSLGKVTEAELAQGKVPSGAMVRPFSGAWGSLLQPAPSSPLSRGLARVLRGIPLGPLHVQVMHDRPMEYLQAMLPSESRSSLQTLLGDPSKAVTQTYLQFAAAPRDLRAQKRFARSMLLVLRTQAQNVADLEARVTAGEVTMEVYQTALNDHQRSLAAFSDLAQRMRVWGAPQGVGTWTRAGKTSPDTIWAPGILFKPGSAGTFGAYIDMLPRLPKVKLWDNQLEMQRRQIFRDTTLASA